MKPADVLREIRSRGLSVTVHGTDLRLQGPREAVDPGLVELIRSRKAELIAYLSGSGGHPLTRLQRSYLVGRGEALELGNVASHIFHEIEGVWDLDRLEEALRATVARHGILRTRFTADGRQEELPHPVDVRIGRLDLRHEADKETRVRELRELRSHRILPADSPPLLAADAIVLGEDRMVLHISHDGLILDGISMFLFFLAWHDAYLGKDVPEDSASFADFVAAAEAAKSSPAAARSREYWVRRLATLAPHPRLPLATAPGAITRPRFSQHCVGLAPDAWRILREHARARALTPTSVLMAAYAETLRRWGAGARFTLNTTIGTRPPIHPRIMEALGNFCDTMLVEVDLGISDSFEGRAAALQAQLRRDMDHRHFSGIEVVRELVRSRASASEARMPYTFNSTLGYPLAGVDGSALEVFGHEVFSVSQTPQVWLNAFAMERHGGLVVQLDGVADLFPEGLLESIAEGFQRMLDALADPAAWGSASCDLLPRAQRERRAAANDTAVPMPDAMLTDAFARHATRAPTAPAIWTTQGTIDYGSLLRRALDIAAWLRARQVGRDELVALVMRRGPEQIAGILGTLLAGAAYLPADARLPANRLDYMLRDGGVRCVLTNTDWRDERFEILPVDIWAGQHGQESAGAPAAGHRRSGGGPDDLAYVLYTSGTTGTPKGVMVSHRSAHNVVTDCNSRFRVGPSDRLFAISAFHFDLSVYDIFGALSAGAAIVMPDEDKAADPAHWLDLCGRAGVTIWNSVPAIVSMLHDQAAMEEGFGSLAALRLVMMSGDRVPAGLPATLIRRKPGLEVVCLGGPTETTIWNIMHPIGPRDDGSHAIPYGRPNANNRAYVIDEDGNDTPDWVPGEIHAAGTGLARGYWGDAERTRASFRADAPRGERLYRTGDLGYYLPSGEIGIAGRADFQMKVNGYRVEAGDVETHLLAHPQVRQAAVVKQRGSDGDRLVAHLVGDGAGRPSDVMLQQNLRAHLPDYMVPAMLVWHDSLPLTANGKVNRRVLEEVQQQAARTADEAAAPEVEKEVAELWASVLRVASVDSLSDLYDLGGDSISGARILTGVRKRFGVTIPLDWLPEVRTVRSMAARISALAAAEGQTR